MRRPLAVAIHSRQKELHDLRFSMVQDRQNQFILRRKVLVQAHLGNVRFSDDSVNTHRPQAFLVKQTIRRFEDSLASV